MTKLLDVDAEEHLLTLTINMMSFPMRLNSQFSVSENNSMSYYLEYSKYTIKHEM